MLANNLMEVSAEQGVGGLNLQPARDLGPRVPYVRKISELNRESPLMKSTSPSIAPNADRVHDVAKLNRFESLRSVLTRPTGGGRGLKSPGPSGQGPRVQARAHFREILFSHGCSAPSAWSRIQKIAAKFRVGGGS